MRAYVKVRKGNFPDSNYYAAWKGFDEIGYDVIKFEEEEIDTLKVTEQTPVFCGIGSCRKLIKKFFGWDYTGINPYPDELMPFMHRGVKRGKWGDLGTEALEGHKFVKPVIQKQFIGTVMNTILDRIKTSRVEQDHEVYLCDLVEFLSEYRVYVHENEIVGVKHYFGDWTVLPSKLEIEDMIERYRPSCPIAYGLDVGIIHSPDQGNRIDIFDTALVEINDGICLGNYGLDPIHYAEMISARWLQVITKGIENI